jgi:hypothetical protein
MIPIARILGCSSQTAAFMYKRHRRLSYFFSAAPWRLGLVLGLSAILLLMLPAWLCRLALINDTTAVGWRGVGFWQRWNWSLMYTVVLPVIFGGTAALSERTLRVFCSLVEPPPKATALITKKNGEYAPDLIGEISEHVAQFGRYVLWGVLGVSIILACVDIFPVARGLYGFMQGHGSPSSLSRDWTLAAALPAPQFSFHGASRPGTCWNIGFDVLAYAAQTVAVTLGLFWMIQYWVTLNTFSKFLIDPKVDFEFHPWWSDPDHCMGLGEVGSLFNQFLFISLLFQIYVVGHRFQLIVQAGHPFDRYIHDIIATHSDVHALLALTYFSSCTSGMWLLLIFILLPITVVAWVPLSRFYFYLKEVKKSKKRDLRGILDNNLDDSPVRKAALRELTEVEQTSIWPNGDFCGWSFLIAMLVLAITAWLPSVLGYLVAGGGGVLLIKFMLSLKGKPSSAGG